LESDDSDILDPVGDALNSPIPWVVQKHKDRALLLLTKRCHLYCRYCFRRAFSPSDSVDPTKVELDSAIDWILDSGVEEIILSGGDPLAISNTKLANVLDRLSSHQGTLRIHTRAPITAPWRVDAELIKLLKRHAPVWMVVHANHPKELSEPVLEAFQALSEAGVRLLNQAVLLRGVNDNANTLAQLSRALVKAGVLPYYLHHPDAAPNTAHFRLSYKEGLRIYKELSQSVSGVALPKYVVDLPDGSGKVSVNEAMLSGQIV
jgi:lysine 2,3-aminomutase